MKLVARVAVTVAVLANALPAQADDGGKVWSLELEFAPPDTTVFRGDGRSPDVIFKEGFQPRGREGDLGLHQTGVPDSAFVSTSKAIAEAEKFARHEKGALYIIRDAKGVDVNETFGKDAYYPDELEIAVPEGTRGDQIVGAWLQDPNGNYTIYVANPDHEPGFRSTDPVLAKDAQGRFYDARNGRRLTDAEVKDAQEREKLYKPSPAVRLVEKHGGVSVALFEHERAGKYGSVEVTAGRASLEYGAQVSATKNGVQAGVNIGGRVTVVEVNAKTKKVAGVQASMRGFVGAEAEASGTAELSTRRLAATGKVGAFDGSKVTGMVTQEIEICGVSVTSTHTVDASWGTGAEAKAYVKIDFASGTVKAGGHVSASLDPGVGYGQEIEISVAKILRNPKGALTCGLKEAPAVAWSATRKGANTAANIGKGAANKAVKVLKKVCVIRCGKKKNKKPFPGFMPYGNNDSRNGSTAYKPPSATTVTGTRQPSGIFFRP